MKRIITLLFFILFLYTIVFSAFAFKIDGNDTGFEWDGAVPYKLVDGESNCGVDFGIVKVKFDYDTDSVYFCFLFSEPGLTPENQLTGISFAVNDSPSFELLASDGYCTYNINPYSYEGAIYIDDNNGVTCEVRVGFKSGLPEVFDGVVRFIDSQGFYSNYYRFTVINEEYETTEENIIRPTSDNTDPAFNSNTDNGSAKKTTKKVTAKETTRGSIIKTSPPYSYTGRTKTTKPQTTKETTVKTTKEKITQKQAATVYYYEKEIYISQVFVPMTTEKNTSDSPELYVTSTNIDDYIENLTEVISEAEENTLSKGTKYKKIVSGVGLAAFLGIAVFGTYSARKNMKTPSDK